MGFSKENVPVLISCLTECGIDLRSEIFIYFNIRKFSYEKVLYEVGLNLFYALKGLAHMFLLLLVVYLHVIPDFCTRDKHGNKISIEKCHMFCGLLI